jgi:hypothetical protein
LLAGDWVAARTGNRMIEPSMKVLTFIYLCCVALTVALIVAIVLVVLAIDGR